MESLKIAIFKEVRQHHQKSTSLSDDELNNLIFHNVTGLRLTFPGFLILKNIFTVYSFEMSESLKARHHIGMSKMEYPFYITSKRLILFSEMDAMMIKLHGGIEGFLETCFNIDRE
jgi:hypothetical protein